MKIFAHRGYSAKYPENSLLAFQKAVEVGCDGIELDVHFSRDSQLVIIHDDSLSRTTDAVGFVRHHSLRDLKNYELRGDYEGEAQHILTLEEYLQWAKDLPILTNIELKNDRFRYPGMEEAVVHLLHKYNMMDKVILSSFRAESIQLLTSRWPKLRCGWLIDEVRETTLEKALAIKATSIHPSHRLLDADFVAKYQAAGLEIYTYTVNTDEEIERMAELGVDGIFTNFLERARELLGLPVAPPLAVSNEMASSSDQAATKSARDRLRLGRKAAGLSGGLVGILGFMTVSVVGSVVAAKIVMSLMGGFLS